ncbi:MAG TPA: FAD-binding protein [Acidobacteriota bacterium]|jgi:succinate dehydrogenase / fumarate reductase flavoprotein subunit/fumarate reductase flavoprotein subunit|nr:FAD-binding protein [Acidobacteriota bacterium]
MMLTIEEFYTDILIIGAGGAGLLAALHVHEKDKRLNIIIVVKGLLGQSGCTRMVQGGYNAVLNPADSLQRHFEDTIRGGAFLNNQELAWALVEDAPQRILELENKVGCLFDRRADGTIHQKPFAGQSFDRTVHKGDLTGIEIMSNLRDYVLEHELTVLEEYRGLDLLTDGDQVSGALLLDIRSGKFAAVRAPATLICTGAGATMYRISSPSLEKAGDGMAMAYRAGAEFVDMEMMQFHPTGLLVGNSVATGGLLEEGLRGAGARLYNGLGERFMSRYDPQRMERATRDVISRSSYLEIMEGRGTASGGVSLDASHLGEDFLLRNFPGMVERCGDYGFDLLHERVEVSPSAHYHMGGVRIDLHCRSSLKGLFVAGEDAGGVHGANRLGGNGVADSIVFGGRAGDAMVDDSATRRPAQISAAQVRDLAERWLQPRHRDAGEDVFLLRQRLEDLMWEKVGIVRNGAGLQAALSELQSLRQRTEDGRARGANAFNQEWNEAINVINLTLVAEMIARSALLRGESRGAHYRTDHPVSRSEWLKNICVIPENGEMKLFCRPVEFTRLKPGNEQILP